MEICIYCKHEITPDLISIEHVFPKSFGCPDTFTLTCVCGDCNNGFGTTIDKWLANDSLEGAQRLRKLGSRSGEAIVPRRLRLKIPNEPAFKDFQGATVYPDFSQKNSIIFPPQAGFRDSNGKMDFFTDEDLHRKDIQEELKTRDKSKLRVLAPSQEEHDRMVEFLIKKGIINKYDITESFDFPLVNPSNSIAIQVLGTIDNDIKRAITKIAFNYLAKKKGGLYALKPCFDGVRDYIRGINPNNQFISFSTEPLLFLEQKYGKIFEGHLFIIEKKERICLSFVSLFNMLTYKIILTKDTREPLIYTYAQGDTFQIEDRVLQPLNAVPKIYLPI